MKKCWKQICGSVSCRILIILPDPDPADPDRYRFRTNEKVDKLDFFPENSNMVSKMQKNLHLGH